MVSICCSPPLNWFPLVVDALLEDAGRGRKIQSRCRVEVLGAVDGDAADLEVFEHGEVGEHLAILGDP